MFKIYNLPLDNNRKEAVPKMLFKINDMLTVSMSAVVIIPLAHVVKQV